MKKAAFLDIDGTLHDGFSTINFIYHLYERGEIAKKDIEYFDYVLNEDPRRYTHYNEWGHEVFAEMNRVFAGRTRDSLSEHLQAFKKIIKKNLYDFTIPLLTLLRGQGFDLVFITGTHDFVAEIFADLFEVAYFNVVAPKLAEKDGAFLDHVLAGFNMDQNDKRSHLIKFKETYDLPRSIVVGDSAGDIEMMALVGRSYLLIDDKTVRSVIDKAKESSAVIVDKSLPTTKVLKLFA